MKRDFLKEQKLFFTKYQSELSPNARLLWFEIFNLQNSHFSKTEQDWCEWVKITKTELMNLMGTKGNRAVYAARDELISKGLLIVKSEGGRSTPLYHLQNLLEIEEQSNLKPSDDVSQLSVCGANQHLNEKDLRCQSAPQNEKPKSVCGANQHLKTDFEVLNSTSLINKQVNITTTLLVNGNTNLRDFYLQHRGIGHETIDEEKANSRLETLIAHGKRPEDFETVILKAENSEYIQGRKKEGTFRPSLEWLLKEDVFKRILDGQFDDWKKSTEPKSYRSPVREKQYEEALQADYDWFYGDLAND